MKLCLLSPFIVLAGLILFVGLACGISTVVTPTAIPQNPTLPSTLPPTRPPTLPPILVPTLPPTPTFAPTLTPLPTNTQVPKTGDLIYSTTFNDLSDWNLLTKDDLGNYIIEHREDGLFITIPSANDYAYLYYNLGNANVRLEADVELVGGTNYTYISLACRSSSKGEYVFTLDAGGYWQIGKWDSTNSQYKRLKDGGSVNINVAKAKNHMTGICQGNTLTFKINGATLGTAVDNLFSDGDIGIEVITFDYAHSESVIHNLAVYVP
jgi:hypothetical protein